MKCFAAMLISMFLVTAVRCEDKLPKLIPCPDCTRAVSYRAVSCPHCGCPGSAITTYFLELYPPGGVLQLPVLKVEADDKVGYALCIEENDQRFILVDADLLNGVQVVGFYTIPDGDPVVGKGMEVSDSLPLVRYRTAVTQVQPILVSSDQGVGRRIFLKVGPDETLVIDKSPPDKEALEFWSADARTRLVGTSIFSGGRLSLVDYRAVEDWKPVRPLVFREQTGLLITAETASSTVLSERLKRTEWVSEYLRRRALNHLK